MSHKSHPTIDSATHHAIDCVGKCFYCRKLAKNKKDKFENSNKGFAWDESSVIL